MDCREGGSDVEQKICAFVLETEHEHAGHVCLISLFSCELVLWGSDCYYAVNFVLSSQTWANCLGEAEPLSLR